MADFNSVISWLIFQEDDHRSPGKIVNLGDGAGLTRLGLTQRWHQVDLPMDYFSTMPFQQAVATAKTVYQKRYWGAVGGNTIVSDIIVAPLLSFAVNDNPHIAVEALQQALGDPHPDGKMGPITAEEANSKDPEILARLFRASWVDFYHRLIQISPSKQQFLHGWINRANYTYPGPDQVVITRLYS